MLYIVFNLSKGQTKKIIKRKRREKKKTKTHGWVGIHSWGENMIYHGEEIYSQREEGNSKVS